MRLTGNHLIDCALIAWLLAQVIKVLLELLVNRTLDVRRFVSVDLRSFLITPCESGSERILSQRYGETKSACEPLSFIFVVSPLQCHFIFLPFRAVAF